MHKEVEIAFAEKNKKLTEELKKYKKKENKEIKLSEENTQNNNINKSIGDSNNQQSSNISLISNNSNINKLNNNNDFTRILSLEKKIIILEKKLESKKKEYNNLKEKNEHIENMVKNQEQKYSGLYHFLEDCLNNFFADENILKKKEIYINNESLRKFEFNNLTKQEKYSILIILMKYLMPLIYGEHEVINSNFTDNCKIKYHFPKENRLIINDRFRKIIIHKKQLLKNSSSDNIHKSTSIFQGRNSYDTLPSILRGSSFKKINTKMPTTGSAISSTTVNFSSKN